MERRLNHRSRAWLALLLALLVLVPACGGDDDADGGAVQLAALLDSSDSSLATWTGREVDVSEAEVVAVVEDAGFWVGGDDRRVFVEIEDETGLDEVGLEEGDTVSFTGTVEQNREAETYGLRGDDAALYREQRAHIRVQSGDIEQA